MDTTCHLSTFAFADRLWTKIEGRRVAYRMKPVETQLMLKSLHLRRKRIGETARANCRLGVTNPCGFEPNSAWNVCVEQLRKLRFRATDTGTTYKHQNRRGH